MRRQPELPLTHEALRNVDRELARLAAANNAHRLRIGELLAELVRRDWYHELGFSTFSAYVHERCNQSVRWALDTCALARKLSSLPILRAALYAALLSWSKVELVARKAKPDTEAALAFLASQHTVRRLRELLRKPGEAKTGTADASGNTSAEEDAGASISMTASAEDAWLLEFARALFDQIQSGASDDSFVHWLAAEGMTSLRELVPAGELAEIEARTDELREQSAAWRAQLQAWCNEAEARVEERLDLALANDANAAAPWEHAPAPGSYATARELDAHIRQVCRELVTRDLLLGTLAERFWRSDGWRRLGYASERQYATERLGISIAAIKAKRLLARSSTRMPSVAKAIEDQAIGFDAALLVTRIATENTVDAWVARAAERTIKDLRDEVETAEFRIRLGGKRDQLPPNQAELDEIAKQRLETRKAIAGVELDKALPFAKRALTVLSQMSGEPAGRTAPSGEANEAAPGSASGSASGSERRRFGRVRYRFSVSHETREAWNDFEEWFHSARGFLPSGVSPIRFLAISYCIEWIHELDKQVKYAEIYARDGHRCQSPVCTRRDKTPHHLIYRAFGGSDDPENLVTLCVWCHLFALHNGLIKARGPASNVRWELGRDPILIVEGRKKVELNDTAPAAAA